MHYSTDEHHIAKPFDLRRKQHHQPIAFVDEFGAEALRVPVDRYGLRHAIVDPRGYQRVLDSGLTGAWFLNGNGQGRRYVRTATPGRYGTILQVARVISGAGAGEVIRYYNGDSLDLRGSNLLFGRGQAKRRDTEMASSRGNASAS